MKQITRIFARTVPLIPLFLLIGSCQKLAEEDTVDAPVSLKISTRAPEEADIHFPVCIYAFSSKGKYIDRQQIASNEEEMNFRLPEGSYRLVALAGIGEEYIIEEKPQLDDVIRIADRGYAKTPLMHGMADVTLKGKSAKAVITLGYAVAAVHVNLSGIKDADEVKVSISPHYPHLSLAGKYSGDGTKLEADCIEDGEGNWRAGPCYIFPGSASKTVFSITVIRNGETQVYGYTYSGAPQANRPFNATGTYNGVLDISGTLVAKGWEEPIDVNFTFGEKGDEDPLPDDPEENGEIPAAGTIWNDCIVVGADHVTATGADLLLLSMKEWRGKAADAEQLIRDYSVNGIGEWRLPSADEARGMRKIFLGPKLRALNARIVERGKNESEIAINRRYLCKNEKVYYTFQFAEGKNIIRAGTKTTYLIRVVKKYRFTVP